MSVGVTFYSGFSKKLNSTAIPSGGTVVNCELRSGSDKFNPSLEIRGVNPVGFNYMYIPLFSRFYYIDTCEWNAEESFWLVSGDTDPLASFRTQIHNSTQWVTRWSGSDNNLVYDEKLAVESAPSLRRNIANLPFTLASSFASSCVICNIVGTGYVCMTGSSYNSMINQFIIKNDPVNVGTYFTQDIARNLTNPASYILSAMAVPIAYLPAGSGSGFNPVFGWYSTDNTVYRVAENYQTFTTTVGSGIHPQSTSADDYLNYPPYTNRKLYVSGIGLIALDNSRIAGAENLTVVFTIDYTTGVVIVRVKKEGTAEVVGYATGQIGYSLAVAQAHSADMVGMIGGTLMGSVMGGAHAGIAGALAGGASGVLGGIGSLGNNSGVTVHGSTGGAGAWYDTNVIQLITEFKPVTKPHAATMGTPYYKTATLSSLGGYVVCAEGDVAISGNLREKSLITQALKGGVYIE